MLNLLIIPIPFSVCRLNNRYIIFYLLVDLEYAICCCFRYKIIAADKQEYKTTHNSLGIKLYNLTPNT
jgi:hypothetical protein